MGTILVDEREYTQYLEIFYNYCELERYVLAFDSLRLGGSVNMQR